MNARSISTTVQALLAFMMTIFAASAAAEQSVEYDFRVIVSLDKALMQKIQKRLAAGAGFDQLARENSSKPTSGLKHLHVHLDADNIRPVFAEELARLKPGERSKTPRPSEYGWFLIKLESVNISENDSQETLEGEDPPAPDLSNLERARNARNRKASAQANAQANARAELEAAKEKFTQCARRASDLEGEEHELKRRIDMHNSAGLYAASELRADSTRFDRKASAFDSDCSELSVNDEIMKICEHPAYQSRWCSGQ